MSNPSSPVAPPRWSSLVPLVVFLAGVSAWLGLTAATDKRGALAEAWGHLVMASLFGGVFAIIVATFIARAAQRPSVRALGYAKNLLETEDAERPPIGGDAELRELVATVEAMASRLHRAERELNSERDRLDRVVMSMQEGVLLLDKDGHVQLVNDALRQMLLLGPQLVGERAGDVLPDEELSELLSAALRGENSSRELELRGPPPKLVLANVRRLNRRRGALAVLVDITERRRLETVRQEFVANASHELRTPIAAIFSAVETLQGAAAGNPEASRTFLSMIERNVMRLRALVDDLLEVSQLESGRFSAELEVVSARRQVDMTLAAHAAAAAKRRTQINNEIPTECRLLANSRGLDHVIGNLVQNAINYCPEGAQVRISCTPGSGTYTLLVADNGPGIAAEHRDRLFERFYRVDAGRSRDVGGTGLGLSIVKHWVEAMKGTIRVTSDVGRGSTFAVTLLRAPDDVDDLAE